LARQILAARLVNGGQVCLCPDYAWVPAEDIGSFVAAMGKACVATATDVRAVSIINDKNFARIVNLVEDAKSHGANVIHLLGSGRSPYQERTRTITPTLVLGVNDDMAIAHEEVFGPVLAIHPYRRIEDVVNYVASRPTPLAAYWYGRQDKEFETFRRSVDSGGMTVNDFGLHCALYRAPFGGVGRSGYGAYHGKTGFDRFTHYRTVTTSRLPINFAELITPPYSPRLSSVTTRMLGWQRKRVTRRLRKADDRPAYVTG
jgi:coniferyl-aldehyde dehydrogenase